MKKDLGLYLHIPFCIKKCAYCDFLSWQAKEEEHEKYVKALIKEIRSYGEFAKKYRVSTVFIGGGTPSCIEPKLIAEVMDAVKETFELERRTEITMEMNPGTVTKEKLQIYKDCGINRVSLGLQSTDNEALKNLGRIHTYEEFLESYQMVREAGFDNVNIDLISSTPGQTVETWKENLSKVLELKPEHLSVYQLIIEEGTPFYDTYAEHQELLPDEETSRSIYEITGEMLKEDGYLQYEISNYAKEGKESKHNLKYWEREEYLGLGLGAASMIHNIRMSNTKDINTYLEKCENPKTMREDVQFLEERQQIEEFMFLGLRKTRGISVKEFHRVFGRDIYMVYEKTLEKFLENGLLVEEHGWIRLSQEGILVSNAVLAEFIFS